jgi:V/A-type H+-transporting ATPase subunit F
MYKIAVLGDNESVLGFKALGLDVFPCDNSKAKDLLHDLAKQNYAVIYITEQIAKEIKPEIDEYKDSLTPAIILIPSKEGSLGIGMNNVRICVERAVGADILDK